MSPNRDNKELPSSSEIHLDKSTVFSHEYQKDINSRIYDKKIHAFYI